MFTLATNEFPVPAAHLLSEETSTTNQIVIQSFILNTNWYTTAGKNRHNTDIT